MGVVSRLQRYERERYRPLEGGKLSQELLAISYSEHLYVGRDRIVNQNPNQQQKKFDSNLSTRDQIIKPPAERCDMGYNKNTILVFANPYN